MKKLFYAGFCLALVMGVGCAISNYPVMVDGYTGEVINTNGKAYIMPSTQISTTWPDGTDCAFSCIDQKASGAGVITTYNHFTTDGSNWIDNTYCTSDWNGCAMVTCENGGYEFDYVANWNCKGVRSLYYVVNYTSRIGECGNASLTANNVMNALDVVSGNEMVGVINRSTTQAYLTSNGFSSAINIYGSYPFTLDLQQNRVTMDMSSPLWNAQRRVMTNFRDNYQEGPTTLDLYFKGVHIQKDMNIL